MCKCDYSPQHLAERERSREVQQLLDGLLELERRRADAVKGFVRSDGPRGPGEEHVRLRARRQRIVKRSIGFRIAGSGPALDELALDSRCW